MLPVLYFIPFLISPNILTATKHSFDMFKELSAMTPRPFSWVVIANLERIIAYL